MKTRFTQKFLLAFLMMGLFTASQAQTYVNGAATGANDGSSWADAYTDLSTALGAATSDVWIAAGTYVPADQGLDTFNTFLVTTPVNIYGGFAGTEASIDDRVAGNTTVLSGDVAGNDSDNDFTANREDNVSHVMTIDVGADDAVILDGLTFAGGDAFFDNGPDDDYIWAGSGVYTVSTVAVNNCNFNNNSAASAAGLYITGDGDGSSIDNSTFEKSQVSGQAGGAMANTIDGFTVTNSTFRDNVTARGALYPLRVTNLMVDNCTFTNNVNNGGFGGAMFIWNSVGTVQNCTFTGNSSGNAAGIYSDGREQPVGTNHINFDNLTFDGNNSLGFVAAGIYTFNSSHTMSNCSFLNNTTIQSGGGHYDSGDNQIVISNNNVFRNNSSQFSGGQATYGTGTTYMITGNTYERNTASVSGGGVLNAFGAMTTITDCFFEDNQSEAGSGGAIYTQNDTTTLALIESQFFANNSDGGAGVIGLGGPSGLSVSKCYFEGNSGDFGGVIGGSEQSDGEFGEITVTIDKSIFRENFAATQGAALSLIDFDTEITNSEFSFNINQGEGAGGAMSLNATDTSSVDVTIINSTLVDNFGIIGAGIASFTGELDSKLNIRLTNTILSNSDGLNYEIEDGSPKFQSDGGNISTDDSTSDAFTNTNDINEADSDDLFEDVGSFELVPSGGSLAIDNGVVTELTEDLNGNERLGAPDSGAYEGGLSTATVEVLENAGQLTMYPNPAATVSKITVNNTWKGLVNITVSDMTGKVVSNQFMNKSATSDDFNLNVSALSEGTYILSVRAEDKVVSTQFVKI
jgi:predicted outer membrane repeat protein